jgi:hypothetical protein
MRGALATLAILAPPLVCIGLSLVALVVLVELMR